MRLASEITHERRVQAALMILACVLTILGLQQVSLSKRDPVSQGTSLASAAPPGSHAGRSEFPVD